MTAPAHGLVLQEVFYPKKRQLKIRSKND